MKKPSKTKTIVKDYFSIIKDNMLNIRYEGYWIVTAGLGSEYKEVQDLSLERAIDFFLSLSKKD